MSPMERESEGPGFLSTELANTVTHAVGLACSLVGLVALVWLACLRGTAIHVVACSVYGSTLVLLYLSSTLYHSSRHERVRSVMRTVDHAAIYLLIAGTYTPFALISLHGPWGWSVFGVAWTLAAVGIAGEIIFGRSFQHVSLILYLAMGWMCAVILKPLLAHLPAGGILWLVAGGLAYTLGVVFYLWRALPHHHAIWHLFVMGGSTCHFFAVMFFVLPRAAPL